MPLPSTSASGGLTPTNTKRKYLSKDAREIVWCVYNYLKKHHTSGSRSYMLCCENKITIFPCCLGNLLEKVSEATAVPRSTISRIIAEGKKIEAGEATVFSSRALHNHKPSPKSTVDNFAEEVIRRTIYNFHILKKQRPTVNAVYNEIKDDAGVNFSGKQSSFRKLLKRMGFRLV